MVTFFSFLDELSTNEVFINTSFIAGYEQKVVGPDTVVEMQTVEGCLTSVQTYQWKGTATAMSAEIENQHRMVVTLP
jgi:hypothetical protein